MRLPTNRISTILKALCLQALIAASIPAFAQVGQGRADELRGVALRSPIRGEKITALTASAGGLIAIGTNGGHLTILDRGLGPWRGGWQRSVGREAISGVTFSADETTVVAIAGPSIFQWRLTEDRPPTKYRLPESPDAFALSRDGRLLALGHFDVYVVDLWNGRVLGKFERKMESGALGTIADVAFSPDGNVVVAASGDYIDAWDLRTRRPIQHWSCNCNSDGVTLSGDAAFAVFGTSDAHAVLWERASGRSKDKTISVVDGDHVYGTAIGRAGALVAAGTASGSVVVWDTVLGRIVARAELASGPITMISMSQDGSVLLLVGQGANFGQQGPEFLLIAAPGMFRR